MAQQVVAFTPTKGGLATTIAISAASTAVATALASTPVPNVRIYNSGAGVVFVAFGPSTTTAALSTSVPIAAGMTDVLGCSRQSYISVIYPTGGTATVYVTPGEGM